MVGTAVKVTLVPVHIFVALALTEIFAAKIGFTVTLAVFLALMVVRHPPPEAKFVIVTVVVPTFKVDVVKVPVLVLPAVNVIVAVFPVAYVAPPATARL